MFLNSKRQPQIIVEGGGGLKKKIDKNQRAALSEPWRKGEIVKERDKEKDIEGETERYSIEIA